MVGGGGGSAAAVGPVPVTRTANSNSEYPYGVARAVPFIRTYRPVPFTVRVCVPPVPVVVVKMFVHGPPAAPETWIWNDRANAASQLSTTWQIVRVEPRSTWIHCGSLNALDQRVPALPSKALDAGKVAFSAEDAVAGRPWADVGGAAAAAAADRRRRPGTPTASSRTAVARAVPFIRT